MMSKQTNCVYLYDKYLNRITYFTSSKPIVLDGQLKIGGCVFNYVDGRFITQDDPLLMLAIQDAPEKSTLTSSPAGKWTVSTDEEYWDAAETYDTKEQAIESVLKGELSEFEPGCTFYVGQIQDSLDCVSVDAASFIDDLTERVAENSCEFADSWVDKVRDDGALRQEVQEALDKILEMVTNKHDPNKSFYNVGHITSHYREVKDV